MSYIEYGDGAFPLKCSFKEGEYSSALILAVLVIFPEVPLLQ